jgi:hypothetical protein
MPPSSQNMQGGEQLRERQSKAKGKGTEQVNRAGKLQDSEQCREELRIKWEYSKGKGNE